MVARSAKTIQVLHKVVGVADLYAWANQEKVFEEISPKTVKRLVTGDPNAEKDEVAKALEAWVGKQDYACDDESDACAVGIAWLMQRGMIEPPFEKK